MKNSKIGAIIKNDVERSIKNKWFVILNVCMLLFTVIGLNFNIIKNLLKNNNISVASEMTISSEMTIYLEDKDNIAYEKLAKKIENTENVKLELKDNIEEYKNSNIDSNVILLKVKKDKKEYVKAELITKEAVSTKYIDVIEETLSSIKDSMISENKNLTEDEINQIKAGASVERIMLAENIDNSGKTSLLQIISNYIIFFVLLLCLNKIANTISQEKMSKSIEYILTSITTKEYIISKVLSMSIIVVIQFIFEIAYLVIAIMLSTILSLNMQLPADSGVTLGSVISIKNVIYVAMTFAFLCLTTFLQGVIQSVMSAKTTNIQEAGNATILLVMINLILYTLVLALVSPLKTTNVITYIISVIPIISMYFIPAMYLIGQANILQIIVAFVILIASIPISVIVAQKPFKNAILDFSPKKDKKIEGIEKILSTREYQERIIERKQSSKKGLIIGMAVILLLVLQVITGLLVNVLADPIASKITFISRDNIYLILMCIVFAISIYLPYLLLKAYIPKEEKINETKEDKKASILKCIKYIVLSIPIISVIQMVCTFAIEKMGLGVNVTDTLGLFNYNGKLSVVLMFLQVAILPAIFEELFIRKGVIGILKDRGAILAVFVSSIVFATIHMNTSQFIFAFLIGILFGIVRIKTGKMYPTMILHFLNNGFAVVNALFYDYTIFIDIFTYMIIGINAVGFCILIYMLYSKIMELKDKESIQRLKEKLDYRKIKLNIVENMYVFKDFTFAVTVILSVTLFIALDKILTLM